MQLVRALRSYGAAGAGKARPSRTMTAVAIRR